MKKILALVLAVLTLMGLSTAVFAGAPVYTQDQILSILTGGEGSGLSISLNDFLPVLGFWGSGSDLVTSWVSDCPKDSCNGEAYYYVDNGDIRWFCKKCMDSGVLSMKEKDNKLVCPGCGKTDTLVPYAGGAVKDGKVYDLYICKYCGAMLLGDLAEKTTPSYGVKEKIPCLHTGCKKTAAFKSFSLLDGKVLARYECEDHHTFDIVVDTSEYPAKKSYVITVVSVTGGDYAITGSAYAKYGESKTVTFYPKTGYVLTDVTVNGTSVAPKNNSVTFTVKGDTTVRPYYVKTETLKDYTLIATVSGNGKITATKNAKSLSSPDKFTAKNSDTVVYSFVPASANYKVSDVKIDGVSKGAVKSYTFSKLTSDHKIEVSFAWASPYADVESKYLAAVEYVTEAGIMGAYSKDYTGKYYFSGRTGITVGDLVCALAELSDTGSRLNNDTDRKNWAINYGVVSTKTDFSAKCNVQEACTVVKNYLEVLEDVNKVSFTKLDRKAAVRDNAISLNLATGATFDKNRDLHRYDLAAICRLIARLDYKG